MNTTRRGFSIRTFLAQGSADSVQLIDHSQWVGRGVVVPRAALDEHADRDELRGNGVFMLCGTSHETGCERIYIGQTSVLHDNLDRVKSKGFWTKLVAFSTDSARLSRTHADYIEAKLLQMARDARGAEMDNTKSRTIPDLAEPDRADADYFIDQISQVAPIIGVRAFEPTPDAAGAKTARLTGNGANANGYAAGGRFVVTEGSMATRSEGAGCPGHVLDLRTSLILRGVLAEEGKQLRFTQDFAFDHAAQAAQLVLADAGDESSWRTGSGSASAGEEQPQAAERSEGNGNGTPGVTVKPIRATKATADA
ncbi:MAG: hypothetical protein DHS20C14_07480 [Phycisphaeraceae bacterium]|nr:MAG: hypothetical protein DHS20C14_07480 [Phycisphaeraceae bacterium]